MEFLARFPYCTTEDVCIIPQLGKVSSRAQVELKPLFYNAPMDTVASYDLMTRLMREGEFAVVDRKSHLNDSEAYASFVSKWLGHPNMWLSVGLREVPELLDRLGEVLEGEERDGGINILIDVSHGHTEDCLALYQGLRSNLPQLRGLMSGSICTPEAAVDAVAAGCTHLRVGVGPGAMCTTRIQTGVGVPNLSAVYMIRQAVPDRVEIIADGGIKESGQIAKYLAAGATGVMVGTRWASTWESGGWVAIAPHNTGHFDPTNPPSPSYIKRHRGQASKEYQRDYGCARLSTEGVGTTIEWAGETLEELIQEWRGNLQSTASFVGVTSIADINPKNVKMARVTPAAYQEGTPHGA